MPHKRRKADMISTIEKIKNYYFSKENVKLLMGFIASHYVVDGKEHGVRKLVIHAMKKTYSKYLKQIAGDNDRFGSLQEKLKALNTISLKMCTKALESKGIRKRQQSQQYQQQPPSMMSGVGVESRTQSSSPHSPMTSSGMFSTSEDINGWGSSDFAPLDANTNIIDLEHEKRMQYDEQLGGKISRDDLDKRLSLAMMEYNVPSMGGPRPPEINFRLDGTVPESMSNPQLQQQNFQGSMSMGSGSVDADANWLNQINSMSTQQQMPVSTPMSYTPNIEGFEGIASNWQQQPSQQQQQPLPWQQPYYQTPQPPPPQASQSLPWQQQQPSQQFSQFQYPQQDFPYGGRAGTTSSEIRNLYNRNSELKNSISNTLKFDIQNISNMNSKEIDSMIDAFGKSFHEEDTATTTSGESSVSSTGTSTNNNRHDQQMRKKSKGNITTNEKIERLKHLKHFFQNTMDAYSDRIKNAEDAVDLDLTNNTLLIEIDTGEIIKDSGDSFTVYLNEDPILINTIELLSSYLPRLTIGANNQCISITYDDAVYNVQFEIDEYTVAELAEVFNEVMENYDLNIRMSMPQDDHRLVIEHLDDKAFAITFDGIGTQLGFTANNYDDESFYQASLVPMQTVTEPIFMYAVNITNQPLCKIQNNHITHLNNIPPTEIGVIDIRFHTGATLQSPVANLGKEHFKIKFKINEA